MPTDYPPILDRSRQVPPFATRQNKAGRTTGLVGSYVRPIRRRSLQLLAAVVISVSSVQADAAFAATIAKTATKTTADTTPTTTSDTASDTALAAPSVGSENATSSTAKPQAGRVASTTKPSGRQPKTPQRTTVGVTRFGGRVQQDKYGNWIVDGSVLGLASINIPAGADAVFDTTLPAGLAPLELRGHYVVPSAGVDSTLEVGVSGSSPKVVTSNSDRTFTADAELGGVGDGNTYVEFTARSKINTTCSVFLPSQIDAVSLVASGNAEPPATLADFFPPYLDRLIIRVDGEQKKTASSKTKIDEETAQAVLDLTTFAVQHWPAAHVVVADESIPTTPYDRVVSIQPADKGSLALSEENGQTTLVLSGPRSKYSALAEFMGSPTLQTSFVRTLKTNGTTYSRPEISNIITVGDIRGKAPIAKGFGTVEQVITVTQSQLGGQTNSIAVNVSGTAQVVGTGQIVVQLRANDQVLASKRVSNDEPFTLKGTISRSTLARDNVIIVRASELDTNATRAVRTIVTDRSGTQTSCEPARPEVTLQLDPGSQFAATPGRGLPAGFDRFPQAFVPGFDVRFSALGTGELQAAADVLQLLQSLSAPRLIPDVIGPSKAHKPTRPMIFIGPPTDELSKLDTPIVPEKRLAKNAEPISVLQGFAATGDDHLVLVTNGKSSDLASTLQTVQTDPRGWRSLRGDVLVRQNGRVRNVRVRPSLGSGEERSRIVEHSRIGYALQVGFAMGAAVALLGGLLTRIFGKKHH